MIQMRKPPMGVLSGLAQNPWENKDGIDVRNRDAVWANMDRLGLNDPITPKMAPPPIPGITDAQPLTGPKVDTNSPVQLPKMPPSARSTDPWSKANVRRTLLDLSAAFGSSSNFGDGMGRAAQALGGRMDQLRAEATPQRRGGVGPDGTFEAVTDPVTGETTYNRIPEFQRAVDEERDADWKRRNAPSQEDTLDLRARAIAAIRRLPADQQAIAYQRLLVSPESFGNVDTTAMPKEWDPMWGEMTEGLGLTTSQAAMIEHREREYDRKQRADRVRAEQGGQRIEIARNRPPPRRPAPAAAKLPSGFILD